MLTTRSVASIRRFCTLASALAVLVGWCTPSLAAPFTWTGATSTDWNVGTNWSPNGIPAAADDVTIPAGAPGVTISTVNVTVQSLNLSRPLTVGAGRTLTVGTASLQAVVTLASTALLSGGTYTIGAGGNLAFPSPCSFGRLSGLTINGDLNFVSAGIRWNNVVLNGTLSVTGAGDTRIALEGNQTLTGAFAASTTGNLIFEQFSAGTLTIAPAAVIRGGDITFNRACFNTAMTVINNGTIDANISGRGIVFDAAVPLTNNATLRAGPGTLTVSSTLINNGTIDSTAGAIAVNGAFNPLVGTMTGNNISFGGTVDLGAGTFNLTGRTFRINGTLQNGTVNVGAGNLTFPIPCTFGRLSGLTINGDLNFASVGIRWNNVVLNGTLSVTGAGDSRIALEGNQTLTGTFAASTTGNLYFEQFTAGTLTIAPAAVIRGGDITFNRACFNTAMTVINNGTIDANLTGRAITVAATVPLTNNGTLRAGPGTLTVSGTLTNNGTIDSTAGSIAINGTFNPLIGTLTGNNFNFGGTLDLGGGTLNLGSRTFRINGTLQNGTVNIGAGNLTFPSPCTYGRLSGLTINGDLNFGTAGIRWNNVVLNGTLSVTGSGETRIALEGSQTLTGTFAASTTGNLYFEQFSAGTLTIAPASVIRGGDITFNRACFNTAMTVTNNGTIDANISGRGIVFDASVPLTNNNTLRAGPGTLTVNSTLINNGTIDSTAGAIAINGAFNPLLGTLTGNNISIGGTADLGGGTFNLGSRTFRINGTLQNGTVNIGAGNLRFPSPCTYGRLSGLTINGDLNSGTAGIRWNSVVLNGTLSVTGAGETRIAFEGSQTLTGTFAASTTGNLYFEQFSAGTLTIAPASVIRGGDITFNRACFNTAMTVTNNGTIDANISGRGVVFDASVPLTNNGTLRAGPGTLTVNSTLINNGTLNSTAGAIAVNGAFSPLVGTMTGNNTSFGGTADLGGGTFDLAGRTFRINGTLQNGTVNINGGRLTFPTPCNVGRISNLTINGDLPVGSVGIRWNNIVLNGTLSVTGAVTSRIAFEGSQTLIGTFTAATTGGLNFEQFSAGTLTIAPSTEIRGGDVNFGPACFNVAMTLVNNGTIAADVAGRTISFNTLVPLTNNGTVIAGPGPMTVSGPISNYTAATNTLAGGTWIAQLGARLTLPNPAGINVRTIASGTVVTIDGAVSSIVNSAAANVVPNLTTLAGELKFVSRTQTVAPTGGTLTNSGTLTLDRSPLTITGDYVQSGGGTLALGVGGAALTQYGRIAVSGNASLNGTLNARPTGGYLPPDGQLFSGVTATAVAGVFAQATGGNNYLPTAGYTPTLARFTFTACPLILTPVSDAVVCTLGSGTFTADVFGAPPLTYVWQRDVAGSWVTLADGLLAGVGTISGAGTTELTVAQPQVTGLRLRYIVSNICGPVTSNVGTLVIAVRCSLADVVGTSGGGVTCNDGVVDGGDFIAFINSFATGDVSADALADVAGAGADGFEPDGIIDGGDFIAFINAFAAGC